MNALEAARTQTAYMRGDDLPLSVADESEPNREAGVAHLLATPAATSRAIVKGGSFILDTPAAPDAVWGEGDDVLWSSGETLLIVGPTGAGKTTIAQQLVLARAGIGPAKFLGYPVAVSAKPIIYIAADRPRQAARSFRRMVDDDQREALDSKLIAWPGPPPFDLTANPTALADFAKEHGAGTIVIDSLKDVAVDLSKDEVGSRVNMAFQTVNAEGIELLVLHHQRKASAGNPKPKALADIYGSVWIPNGAGSVLIVHGEPGDSIVEVAHLKQPSATVGPLEVRHDHAKGSTQPINVVDLAGLLKIEGSLTVQAAARQMFGDEPTANHIEKARRKLDGLVKTGHATKRDAAPGSPANYIAKGSK